VLARAEGARQDRQVFADELLLQVDRVGRHDGALAVGTCPGQRRNEVGERFPDAGARLEQPHPAVVVEVGDIGRHVALAGAVLEAAQGTGHGPARRQERRDVDRIDAGGRARARAFDHHVAVADVVVHNPEPDPAVVQARGDAEIGAGGIEHAARVVVQQELAADGDPRQGQDRVHRAARHHSRFDEETVRVGARDERHLTAVGRGDLGAQEVADRGREPLDAHVLSSRFLAAGNSTLFRMSR
jgi:hypothetical protein